MSETRGGGEAVPPRQTPPSGGFPAAPPGSGRAAPAERPVPVRRAAFAWWGATACWFLGSLLSQVLGGHVASSFRLTTAQPVPAGDGSVLTRTVESPIPTAVAVLAFLICGGLWALLVYGVYRGAGWARVLLAVLGVLGVLNVLLQLIAAVTAPGRNAGDLLHGLFFLGVLGLSVTGLVLMFRAEAGPYFTRRR
jgi:hypothetical protein